MRYQSIVSVLPILAMVCSALESGAEECATRNCQVCSQFTKECVMCSDGHILQINKDTFATECVNKQCPIEGCARCLTQNACMQCHSGYSLTSQGACDQKHIIQENAQDNQYQYQYHGGYSFLSSSSVSCMVTNCASCVTPNFCSSCTSPYVPSADGSTCISTCTTAITNCIACSSSSLCTACANGYTLLSYTSCIQCNIQGCSACSSNNTCSACYGGYTLNTTSNTCVQNTCQYPCATCTNNTFCLTCEDPFNTYAHESSGVCYTCSVEYCTTCNSTNPSICLACIDNYVLSSNATNCTQSCSALCAQGNCTAGVCSWCISGYYLNSAATCTMCTNAPICTSCTNTSNVITCTGCVNGYYLNTVSNTCIACATNCQICTYNSTSNSSTCTTYINGYAFTDSSNSTAGSQVLGVYACDPYCSVCSSVYPASCVQCGSGYVLSISSSTNLGVCTPCSSNCLSCSSTNLSLCLSCYSNAYLQTTSNTCLMCDSGCLTCSGYTNSTLRSTCTSCYVNYYLVSGTCAPCPTNCPTCSSSSVCTSCITGFSLTTNGSCLPCLSNCRVCSSAYQAFCIQCEIGYYMNSAYQCVACSSACLQCSAAGCFQCAPKFQLSLSGSTLVCVQQCIAPCLTCSTTNATYCNTCLLGYTVDGRGGCSPTCVSALNSSVTGCLYTGLGSVISSTGNIITCGSNCARCLTTSTSSCTACYTNYYLSGTTCVSCPTACATCTPSGQCLSCSLNYTALVSQFQSNVVTCLKCDAPCAQCYGTTTVCTTCISGFTFTGWNCVSNFFYTFKATFGVSLYGFYANYEGYVDRIMYSMQTNNMRVLSVVSVEADNSNSTTVTTNISSQVKPPSKWANAQYQNLNFALLSTGNKFNTMTISSKTVTPINGVIDQYHDDTPTILGIVIPLSVLIIGAFIYCSCSKNNMGVPARRQNLDQTERNDTEMLNI